MKNIINYDFCSCVFGNTLIASIDDKLCYISIGYNRTAMIGALISKFNNQYQLQCLSDLSIKEKALAIINGQTKDTFSIEELKLIGTNFQKSVWEALLKIPYGETVSYMHLASYIDRPKSFRAVANACNANPIAIIIPCHRAIRADGKDSEYRWGIDIKNKLLEREKENARNI